MASLLQLPLLREVLHLATQLLALPRLGVPGARVGVQELADRADQRRDDPEGQHRVVLGLGDEVVDELLHDVLLEFGWGFVLQVSLCTVGRTLRRGAIRLGSRCRASLGRPSVPRKSAAGASRPTECGRREAGPSGRSSTVSARLAPYRLLVWVGKRKNPC